MKLTTHKFKGGQNPYTMLEVTDEEALALIESLSIQIRTKNSNSGRLESLLRGGKGNQTGYFSIAVHRKNEHECGQCGNEVEPFTGELIPERIVCSQCAKGICDSCKTLNGHRKFCYVPKMEAMEKIDD